MSTPSSPVLFILSSGWSAADGGMQIPGPQSKSCTLGALNRGGQTWCPCAVPSSFNIPASHHWLLLLFSHSVMSSCLWPHGLQHTRFPWPSLSPRVCSSSFPLNLWCYLTMCMCILTKLKIKKKSSSPKGCLPFKSPRRKPAGSPPGTPAAGRSSPRKIAPSVFLSTLELSLPPWEYLTFLF